LFKCKYCKPEEIFLEYKRAAISAKNKLREIKQDHWKTIGEGIANFTNPSHIWDRMKVLKCRYSKGEREHEYKEDLVKSAKTTYEKQCSGVDEKKQAPAFDHDNQDPFLDSEYTIQELHFAFKNLSPIELGTGWNIQSHNSQFAKRSFRILLEIYNDIL
jgi:hypothetical protein